MPHFGPSGVVAKRIKHSNRTSRSKVPLAKAKKKWGRGKEKKKIKDNKQLIAMRCGKCYISCISVGLSTLYYSRVRGQPVRVQILSPPFNGHMTMTTHFTSLCLHFFIRKWRH